MRTSTAIALGRNVIKPLRGVIFSTDGKEGCAIGMAITGMGEAEWVRHPDRFIHARPPCVCYRDHPATKKRLEDVMAHLFDDHMMGLAPFGNDVWTLDRLIDWVRSVECTPPEELARQEEVKEEIRCSTDQELVARS